MSQIPRCSQTPPTRPTTTTVPDYTCLCFRNSLKTLQVPTSIHQFLIQLVYVNMSSLWFLDNDFDLGEPIEAFRCRRVGCCSAQPGVDEPVAEWRRGHIKMMKKRDGKRMFCVLFDGLPAYEAEWVEKCQLRKLDPALDETKSPDDKDDDAQSTSSSSSSSSDEEPQIMYDNLDKCPVRDCIVRFKGHSHWQKHMQRVHKDSSPYKCVCGLSQESFGAYKQHQRSAHKRGGSFECHVCDATFFSKASVDAHLRGKHNKRLFKCAYCGVKMKKKSHLKDHEAAVHGKSSFTKHMNSEYK